LIVFGLLAMGRHAKNNTAAPTFTRKEFDMLKGVWGKKNRRLGADSLKDFDACALCQHQAKEPLVCPQGHLFCKGCIFESLAQQKDYQKKLLKKWEEQQKEEEQAKTKAETEAKEKAIDQFEKLEKGILPTDQIFDKKATNYDKSLVPTGYEAFETAEGKVYVVNKELVKQHSVSTANLTKEIVEERRKYLPCFWIPNLTPDAGKSKVSKPSGHCMCPEGNHVLRLKQLRPIHFTPASEESSSSSSSSSGTEKKETKVKLIGGARINHAAGRWMCASCRKAITNGTQLACLSQCGHVLCITCVNQFVAKDGSCVSCGEKCRQKDVIRLQQGGTGFAAAGAKIAEVQATPSFQG